MTKRAATPADISKLFADMGELCGRLANPQDLTLREALAIFDRIATDLAAFAPPPVVEELTKLRSAMPTAQPKDARDWAGFFQALAAFAQAIFPLIAPFIKIG